MKILKYKKSGPESNPFTNALSAYIGLRWAIRTEASVRGFATAGFIVVILSGILQVGWEEFALIMFVWFYAVQSEISNTATEKVSDKACNKQYDPLVKKTKDFAAGSVFLANVAAWAVTALLWTKRLFEIASS